ncbi:hypothetical protein L1987_40428 [Smallanthus sonchifolius]|uniref:Uncharacterized protein n=1 Tax=Smallanthus sonchifolius TaxID=185202 RepID=A0ACB9GT00_9ASTR|nr:hypothetical protein L1987_40428 [Smallanthus sonchifolius]
MRNQSTVIIDNADMEKKKNMSKAEMKWATIGNYEDSGFFMRHMETYMGTRSTNRDCGFAVEEHKQREQILTLSKKYAAKKIFSEINQYKKAIMDDIGVKVKKK